MPVAGVGSAEFVAGWLALHVRSNHEWKAERYLLSMGVPAFVPYYPSRCEWSDRVVELKKPLFRGYLFARSEPRSDQRLSLLKTPGLVQVVGFGGQSATIPDETVESLRILCAAGNTRPCAYLREGARARIRTGAFKGAIGIVLSEPDRTSRLVVSVHLLGRSVYVPIDRYEVEPVSD